jgi:miniconductance mechanosensitive channel
MIETVNNFFGEYPLLAEVIKFTGVILLALISYLVTKKIIFALIHSFVNKTKWQYDDILLNKKILRKISIIIPIIVLNQFTYLVPRVEEFLANLSEAMIILLIVLLINNLLMSFNDIYERVTENKKRPIKGYIQVIGIIVYVFGGVIIVGTLTGQSMLELMAGIGAMTAILLLIFKDTILSFVASIQITSYDLVKVGDWIEVPSYGVDGDVMDMSLHTIKIRNFDKTISTLPTNKLIEVSFKNWRGMEETGGRRIKRSIHIDTSSIKFCDEAMLNRFRKFELLSDYIDETLAEINKDNAEHGVDTTELINGRRLTNVGTFRAYLKLYLNSREDIHKGLTFLIRQLSPGPNGLPIEIYVFTTTTAWVKYEDIQADIFDHIFAVIPEFELNAFQSPSSADVQSLTIQNPGKFEKGEYEG